MHRIIFRVALAASLLAAVVFAAGPAAAEKPSWAGKGKGDKDVYKGAPQPSAPQGHPGKQDPGPGHGDKQYDGYFSGRDRSPIDRYYSDQFRHGKCPPGLAKKGKKCVPPGQARKWVMHQPLPREVVFHDLPQEVLVHLGPPPPQHRFVRVAQDILLISIGAGMVIDAIEDIGRELDR
jgi:Ni/Co efflux regulator RcnB